MHPSRLGSDSNNYTAPALNPRPDFQNKKFSWARHFQQQVMTNFGPTQINVLKYTNVLFAVISEKLHQYIFGESDLGKTLQTK